MKYHRKVSAPVAVIVIFCVVFLAGCWRPKGGPDARAGGPGGPGGSFLSTMFDRKPFNTGVDKLPAMYTGHNPELLYNNIRMRKERALREPQETDEEYRKRIDREIYLPLMGSLDFDSVYAFRITPKEVVYNAGDQVMRMRCELTNAFEGGREERTKKAFTVRYQPQLDNRYTITDKRGVRIEVEEIKFSEYAVVAVNAAAFPMEKTAPENAKDDAKKKGEPQKSDRETITTTIKMTPEEAKRCEGNITALLVGRLASPYTSYEEITRKPVPEKPGTYLARYHYLYIQLLDIWFYDVATGKIVKKIGHRS